jgi:site-specific DNA-adenine methylase
MRVETIGPCTLYLADMEEVLPTLDRVDCIFSDPPYLYLKGQDFDRPFDEDILFNRLV